MKKMKPIEIAVVIIVIAILALLCFGKAGTNTKAPKPIPTEEK